MQETQVNEQEHAQIIQNLAWLTTKVWLKLGFWCDFLWQKYYNKQYRKARVTGVSHEWCSQHKGLDRTAQLLIPMSLPACQHQRCWWASQERESLCVNEKQAHFVRFWKFYGRICGWVWNINTQARISLFRVQGRSLHSFYSQGKLLQCLGLSQTSGAVIHPVQLAHYPAPGVQRPGVKSLGV